jgi:hypothetical protein
MKNDLIAYFNQTVETTRQPLVELAATPPEDRRLIALRMLEGLTHRELAPRLVAACLATVLALFAAQTRGRNRIWRDSVTFWRDGVSKWPGSSAARLGVSRPRGARTTQCTSTNW